MRQRLQKQKAKRHQEKPQGEGQEKPGGSKLFCGLCVLRAKFSGNGVAGTVAAKKAQCLNDRHDGKYDANGSGGTGADAAHEKGVRHIIEGCDHHADDGRHRQTADQTGDRGLRHHLIFFILRFSV